MVKKRVVGLDIVRTFAILFVISVHFFFNNGFYGKVINSSGFSVLLFARTLFYTCVPLFLLLTGYLVRRTKINRDYFYKIFKILISYLIIAVVVLIFRIMYMNIEIGKLESIFALISFEADPYAWYVEMYLGLFLLIPFLNIIYDNLNKFQKHLLLSILIFITALAPITNNLIVHGTVTNIFPNWWENIYPITYFFVGRFLYDYPIKLSSLKKIIILLIVLMIHTGLLFWHNYGRIFDWGALGGYGNILTLTASVLIFSLLYNKNIKNKCLNVSVSIISKVSFEMYLISYIFDRIFYSEIKLNFNNVFDYGINFFIYVSLVFICSFVCAIIINKISSIFYRKIRPFYDKIINKFIFKLKQR